MMTMEVILKKLKPRVHTSFISYQFYLKCDPSYTEFSFVFESDDRVPKLQCVIYSDILAKEVIKLSHFSSTYIHT